MRTSVQSALYCVSGIFFMERIPSPLMLLFISKRLVSMSTSEGLKVKPVPSFSR